MFWVWTSHHHGHVLHTLYLRVTHAGDEPLAAPSTNKSIGFSKCIVKENVTGRCINVSQSPSGCCTPILCKWQFSNMSLRFSQLSWCIYFMHLPSCCCLARRLTLASPVRRCQRFIMPEYFSTLGATNYEKMMDRNKGIFEKYRSLIKKQKGWSLFLWFLRVSVDAVQVWQWWCLGALRKEACGIGSAPRQTAGQIHP